MRHYIIYLSGRHSTPFHMLQEPYFYTTRFVYHQRRMTFSCLFKFNEPFTYPLNVYENNKNESYAPTEMLNAKLHDPLPVRDNRHFKADKSNKVILSMSLIVLTEKPCQESNRQYSLQCKRRSCWFLSLFYL